MVKAIIGALVQNSDTVPLSSSFCLDFWYLKHLEKINIQIFQAMFKFLHKQGPIMASSHLYDSMVSKTFFLI